MYQTLGTTAAAAPVAAAALYAVDITDSRSLMIGFTVVAVWTLFVAVLAAWSAGRITRWRVQRAVVARNEERS